MTGILIGYESHQHVKPWKWQGAKFTINVIIDDSEVGMSFLYQFISAEDAIMFKLLFGHCIK